MTSPHRPPTRTTPTPTTTSTTDRTATSGVLTFLGGLILAFAAYWDARRPVERSR